MQYPQHLTFAYSLSYIGKFELKILEMHDSEIYIIMGVEKIWKLQVFTLPSYLSNANHETF